MGSRLKTWNIKLFSFVTENAKPSALSNVGWCMDP